MTKKVTEINPQKTTEIQKRDKKVEGALTYRGMEKEDTDNIKKKVDGIAEKHKIRIDIYQKKTAWAKGDKNEK